MTKEEKQKQEAAERGYKALYNAYVVGRKGGPEFLAWLESTDFFVAPASTRFHGAYPGGLAEHSAAVCQALMALRDELEPAAKDAREERAAACSAVLVALVHDICKADYYKESTRRQKNPEGKWEDVRSYTVREDALPLGHGEKSLYLAAKFFDLTDEEAAAIRWHMGAYCDHDRYREMGQAYDRYPLALLVHGADMIATHRWGK